MRPLHRAVVALAVLGGCARSGPCPREMAQVPGQAVCIDRHEASLTGGAAGKADGTGVTAKAASRKGAIPAVNVSQLQAKAACANAGKRLCTREEWVAACAGGDTKRKYPYGPGYVPERCHDQTLSNRRKTAGPLPTGSLETCRTPEGVYDLAGNVWEWVATQDAPGVIGELIGGGLRNDNAGNQVSCEPKEAMFQPVTQQISGVGLRCCAEATKGR